MAQSKQPDDLKYAPTHEWVRVNGDEATIGISDYAQDELGAVVYLDLPWDDAGKRDVAAGAHFGDIESVKATSELFSPVSGQIVRVNDGLPDHEGLVNTDPYGEGWMLVVKLSNPAELDSLMDAAAYTTFLQSAGH
ncbi:MAG TPA: glycine cleavage system protein GcvH [Ktedonobacterales bacterium]|nr:glycine cleavage system protein GcvH [Ktedonobacterales bacterium]